MDAMNRVLVVRLKPGPGRDSLHPYVVVTTFCALELPSKRVWVFR